MDIMAPIIASVGTGIVTALGTIKALEVHINYIKAHIVDLTDRVKELERRK